MKSILCDRPKFRAVGYAQIATALRVEEGQEDDVYWLHTDHLGSTSLLSDDEGDLEIGTTTRFLPFGDYRTEPESDLTDKGFTGHVQQDDIGLTFMRARFYVSSVGRFAQADSIVPNVTDPRDLNRYAYVRNAPLVHTDPTGHCIPGYNCPNDKPSGNISLFASSSQEPLSDGGDSLIFQQLFGSPWPPPLMGLDDGGLFPEFELPPPPNMDPLYWLRDFLMRVGVDAVGFRAEMSFGY